MEMILAVFMIFAHPQPVRPITGHQWKCEAQVLPNGDIQAEGWGTYFKAIGATASGIQETQVPGRLACALPTGRSRFCQNSYLSPGSSRKRPEWWSKGSAYPLAWKTRVDVLCIKTGRSTVVLLVDEGPAYRAQAGTGVKGSAMIDLTAASWKALGVTADNHRVRIRIRIGRS